jgi:hypothetical protein
MPTLLNQRKGTLHRIGEGCDQAIPQRFALPLGFSGLHSGPSLPLTFDDAQPVGLRPKARRDVENHH